VSGSSSVREIRMTYLKRTEQAVRLGARIVVGASATAAEQTDREAAPIYEVKIPPG
jgi:hypothetical protein